MNDPHSKPQSNIRACRFLGRKRRRRPVSLNQAGFALVVCLALMVLVTVLAIGLLSLSTISLRTSHHAEAMATARSNARLAMMLAIGQLQKCAGPDQRITATADILDGTGAGSNKPGSKATGVWRSWEHLHGGLLNAPQGSYEDEKKERFLGWLASTDKSDDPSLRLDGSTAAEVRLAGTAGGAAPVFGRKIEVAPNSATSAGRYAYAVLDEGVKAKAFVIPPEPTGKKLGNVDHYTRNSAAPRSVPEAIGKPFDAIAPANPDQGKALTLASIPFLADGIRQADVDQHIHDLSPWTMGLLVDVDRGGFKRDLSLATEAPSLPAKIAGDLIPQSKNLFSCPWEQLRSFSRQYKSLQFGQGGQSASANGASGYEGTEPNTRFTRPHLYPVCASFYSIFSYHAEPSSGAGNQGRYDAGLLMTPIITLWNPYNVTLRTTAPITVNMSAMPYMIQFRAGGTVYPNTNPSDPWIPFRRLLGDRTGYELKIGEGVVELAPGESKVFSPANDAILPETQQVSATPIVCKEGYRPQGGWFLSSLLNPKVTSKGVYQYLTDPARRIRVSSSAELSIAVKPDSGWQNQQMGSDHSYRHSAVDGNGQQMFNHAPWMPGKTMTRFLPTIGHSDTRKVTASEAASDNAVCASITLRLKTPADALAPSLGYVQTNPLVALTSYGKHPDDPEQALALAWFESDLRAHPDWDDSYLPQADAGNHGFVASGVRADTGVPVAQLVELPLKPLQSIGALQHLDFAANHYYSSPFQVIGNSVTTPTVPPGALGSGPLSKRPAPYGGHIFQDFHYIANAALFDHYFYSSIAPRSTAFSSLPQESLSQVYRSHRTGEKALPNSRYQPFGSTSDEDVDKPQEDYETIGAKLMVDGAFNINSTSVAAWKAFLGSLNQELVGYRDLSKPSTGIQLGASGKEAPYVVGRFSLPGGGCADTDSAGPDEIPEALFWRGYRALNQQQLDMLAERIVEQVKQRGPFLSLGEFVNRRLSSDPKDRELAKRGAIQAALDDPGIAINDPLKGSNSSKKIDESTVAGFEDYTFPESAEGFSGFGAPGWVTQADLLRPLAPYLAARSDTFRVRGYGEALDDKGHVIARAWCEAVVQRIPDFVVPSKEDDSNADNGNAAHESPCDAAGQPAADIHPVNARFGRRFETISFRWLHEKEI